MSTLVRIGPSLAVAVVALVAAGCAAAYWGHLGHARGVLTAALRAVGQLSLIALVLAGIVGSLAASLAFVASMSVIASLTAARRLGGKGPVCARVAGACAVPVAAGPVLVVGGLLALGVLPATGVAVVPVAGILIGGAMTGTILAGRRGLDELRVRRGEVEAALAIGLDGREAALLVSRPVAAEALVPALDQTRTVGLVALPGAFVGTLLGGATPVEAGAVQVLILVGVLAVQAVAVVVTVELVARGVLNRSAQR